MQKSPLPTAYCYITIMRFKPEISWDFHSKRTCLLSQTSLYRKVRCSVLCTSTSAASIRNPGYRSSYAYRLARPISMILRVQAHSGSWLLSGTFIVRFPITNCVYKDKTEVDFSRFPLYRCFQALCFLSVAKEQRIPRAREMPVSVLPQLLPTG